MEELFYLLVIEGKSSYSYFGRIIQNYRNDIEVENNNYADSKKKTIQNHSANEISSRNILLQYIFHFSAKTFLL